MSPYNILYLHNKTEISGGEISLLNLWENLDRKMFTPVLIIPAEGEFSRRAKDLKVRVIIYALPSLRPWNMGAIIKSCKKLKEVITQEAIHLIHSYTARNNILAVISCRGARIPVIWHERNIPLKYEMDITKIFLFWPNAVICNSKAVARRLGSIDQKVRIILNGVDVHQFAPMPVCMDIKKKFGCENRPVVGIVTNLTLRRRVEYFIEAAAQIRKQKPDVCFFIVGGEFEEQSHGRLKELESKSKLLGLEGSLFLVGRQEDVRPWISIFDICCQVTSQDACSRAILEAMSMQRAMVAMDDGGNPELIENGKSGILVGADDKEGFVKSVIGLLDDDEKREQMGQKARERVVQFFDVRKNAQATQELYWDLIRKARE